jgi:hypothetical protein
MKMQLKNSKATNMEVWKKNIKEVRQRAFEGTEGRGGDRGL